MNKETLGEEEYRSSKPELEEDYEGEFDHSNDFDDKDSEKNKIVEQSPRGRFIRFNEELGSGAYKTVFKGYDNETGCEIAWNVIKLQRLPAKERKRISDEIALLKQLKHPNIIHFISAWINKQKEEVIFITEIVTGGSLKRYLKKIKSPRLKVVKAWCREILQGIEYLHDLKPNPIIHRDIKCDNIFINSNKGEIRIGDLGLATCMSNAFADSVLGTPEFMAPEMYEEVYGPSVDVYAFGMCLLEMVTNETPYRECMNPAQVYKKVINGVRPASLDLIANEEVKIFVMECLKPREERPTASELLQKKFLKTDSEADNQPVPLFDSPTKLSKISEESLSKERSRSIDKMSKYYNHAAEQHQNNGYSSSPTKSEDEKSEATSPTHEHPTAAQTSSSSSNNNNTQSQKETPQAIHTKRVGNDPVKPENSIVPDQSSISTQRDDRYPKQRTAPLNSSKKEDNSQNVKPCYKLEVNSFNDSTISLTMKIDTTESHHESQIEVRKGNGSYEEDITKAICRSFNLSQISDQNLVNEIKVTADSLEAKQAVNQANNNNNPVNISNASTNHPHSFQQKSINENNNHLQPQSNQQNQHMNSFQSTNNQGGQQNNQNSQYQQQQYPQQIQQQHQQAGQNSQQVYFQPDLFNVCYEKYLTNFPKDMLYNESEEALNLRHQREILELQNIHLLQKRSQWDRKQNILSNNSASLVLPSNIPGNTLDMDEMKGGQPPDVNFKVPEIKPTNKQGDMNFNISPFSSGTMSPNASYGNFYSANNSVEVMTSLLKKLTTDKNFDEISSNGPILSNQDLMDRNNLISPRGQTGNTMRTPKGNATFKFPNGNNGGASGVGGGQNLPLSHSSNGGTIYATYGPQSLREKMGTPKTPYNNDNMSHRSNEQHSDINLPRQINDLFVDKPLSSKDRQNSQNSIQQQQQQQNAQQIPKNLIPTNLTVERQHSQDSGTAAITGTMNTETITHVKLTQSDQQNNSSPEKVLTPSVRDPSNYPQQMQKQPNLQKQISQTKKESSPGNVVSNQTTAPENVSSTTENMSQNNKEQKPMDQHQSLPLQTTNKIAPTITIATVDNVKAPNSGDRSPIINIDQPTTVKVQVLQPNNNNTAPPTLAQSHSQNMIGESHEATQMSPVQETGASMTNSLNSSFNNNTNTLNNANIVSLNQTVANDTTTCGNGGGMALNKGLDTSLNQKDLNQTLPTNLNDSNSKKKSAQFNKDISPLLNHRVASQPSSGKSNKSGTNAQTGIKRADSSTKIGGSGSGSGLYSSYSRPRNEEWFKKIKDFKLNKTLKRETVDKDVDLEDIKVIQEALEMISGQNIEPNGHFGHYTEKLVKISQDKSGLSQDGIVTPQSWEKFQGTIQKMELTYFNKEKGKQQEINDLARDREEMKKRLKDKQNKEASESLNRIQSKLTDLSDLK